MQVVGILAGQGHSQLAPLAPLCHHSQTDQNAITLSSLIMLRAHDLSEVEMIAITYPQLINCLSKATLAKARELFLLVPEHVASALLE